MYNLYKYQQEAIDKINQKIKGSENLGVNAITFNNSMYTGTGKTNLSIELIEQTRKKKEIQKKLKYF